jgi:hypothetical protein
MGIVAEQLLPHGEVDEPSHRADLYLLDLDYKLQPGL